MTEEERKELLIKHANKIKKANAEGYAGISFLSHGELVDRREVPNSLPIAENSFFGITKPRCIRCKEARPLNSLVKSICKICRDVPKDEKAEKD